MSTTVEPATVEQVAPGVTRIALPVPTLLDGVNVHLIEGTGPTTLVDAGIPWPATLEALRAAMAEVGVAIEDVEQLLLTHHHFDHVGLATEIAALSGATIAALPAVSDVIADPLAHFVHELEWAERHAARHGAPDELLDGTRRSQPLMRRVRAGEVGRPLEDGDVLDAGDLRLTVRHRPGHSPTDTIFEDGRQGLAFVGDHLWHAAPVTPVLGAGFAPDARPAADYLAGLERTRQSPAARLLTGHGRPVDDAERLVAERLQALGRRVERARGALTDEPATTWEVGLRIWRGGGSAAHGLSRLSALLAALELLEDEGAAEQVGEPDALRWRAAD